MRRTITLPESIDRRVRELALEGESFSAAVARLLEIGAARLEEKQHLSYIGIGEGPPDLGVNDEKYLDEIFRDPDFEH